MLKQGRCDSYAASASFRVMIGMAFCFPGVLLRATDPVIVRHPNAVPQEECFPLEQLPHELQEYSARLLLKALDGEALYTLVGPLKPVSEGFFNTRFRVAPPDTTELEKVDKALAAWRCGDAFQSGVLAYNQIREEQRYASAWFANTAAVGQLISERQAFFKRLGLHDETSIETLLTAVESSDEAGERWRGLGLLFGYPKSAVDFFVRAGEHYRETGEFIERDFRNYPTFSRQTGRFVYAVPQLAPETDEEKLLRKKVENILEQYRVYREQHIGDENVIAVTNLIRDWFNDGYGFCHPNHALQKVQHRAETSH